MASILVKNKIVPATITEDENGLSIRETYHITGLNPLSRSPLYDALNTPGLPAYNGSHPYVPNVFVRSRMPKPFAVSSTEALVDVVWKSPDTSAPADNTAVVRFHGYTEKFTTHNRINGEVIKVNYTPKGGKAMEEQIGEISATKGMGLLEFDFVKQSNPQSMLGFLNKLNSTTYRGQPKWTWLVVDIGIEKRWGKPGWNCHVAMLYDPWTHLKVAYYRLPGGIIPKDIDQPVSVNKAVGNGWRNVLPSEEANLSLMSLPSGF